MGMYTLFVCGTYMGDLPIVIYSDDGKQTTVVRLSGSTEKQVLSIQVQCVITTQNISV